MSSIVDGLIDEYIDDFYKDSDQSEKLNVIMKVSEPSFEEWFNKEDDIYDDL